MAKQWSYEREEEKVEEEEKASVGWDGMGCRVRVDIRRCGGGQSAKQNKTKCGNDGRMNVRKQRRVKRREGDGEGGRDVDTVRVALLSRLAAREIRA